MSDRLKSTKGQVDWRPLIPEHYKTGKEPDRPFPGLPEGDTDSEFRPLYSGGGKQDGAGDFKLIHSPGEYADPDPGAENDGPAVSRTAAVSAQPSIVPTIEQEAYDKGFAKGEKEGFEAGMQQAGLVARQIETILSEVQTLREELVKQYESEILDLVCRAVEKIVYGRVELDNEMVKRAILDAFEMIPELDDITINLNPEDYENIDVLREDVFEQVKDLKNVSIVANSAVGRGGCKVESRSGDIDATVGHRLDAITKSILKAGGRAPDEA